MAKRSLKLFCFLYILLSSCVSVYGDDDDAGEDEEPVQLSDDFDQLSREEQLEQERQVLEDMKSADPEDYDELSAEDIAKAEMELDEAESQDLLRNTEPDSFTDDDLEKVASDRGEALTSKQLERLHNLLDDNHDGKIALHEVVARAKVLHRDMSMKVMSTQWQELDQNKDGTLSLDEYLSHYRKRYKDEVEMFMKRRAAKAQAGNALYQKRLDKEKQGMMEQRLELEKQKFKAADQDGDEVITPPELFFLFSPETHDHMLDVIVKQMLKREDQDGDGQLNSAEFFEIEESDEMPEYKRRFKAVDKDGDKLINESELRHYVSGQFLIEDAFGLLIDRLDEDNDKHNDKKEFVKPEAIFEHPRAHEFLSSWASHMEL
eukprot:TRINITY_DN1363_c5_g1_i1.p1 TRINITY_DN1363_c5_g1~~TRINITY_DN1363_c5_g1_i1.p1  ORF type:complete len:400 (-),score=93.35 TRINITY_DN1363_c5_g1_i1:127-1254(-)